MFWGFFPLHFLLHLKKHKTQNILPAAQAMTDQRIPRNGFWWERNTCIFYVAVANREEFRAGRQVWEACSVAWEGIVSHYHSSLNPRHCPANRNVEEEGFLISLLGLGGFGSGGGRSYIEFPEYSWCTPNCIGYNGIFLLCEEWNIRLSLLSFLVQL